MHGLKVFLLTAETWLNTNNSIVLVPVCVWPVRKSRTSREPLWSSYLKIWPVLNLWLKKNLDQLHLKIKIMCATPEDLCFICDLQQCRQYISACTSTNIYCSQCLCTRYKLATEVNLIFKKHTLTGYLLKHLNTLNVLSSATWTQAGAWSTPAGSPGWECMMLERPETLRDPR